MRMVDDGEGGFRATYAPEPLHVQMQRDIEERAESASHYQRELIKLRAVCERYREELEAAAFIFTAEAQIARVGSTVAGFRRSSYFSQKAEHIRAVLTAQEVEKP